MRALCEKHNLVVAEDGKCVVCRRPPGTLFGAQIETVESVLSKIVTFLLLLGLLGAIGALGYLSTLPEPYSGPKRTGGQAPNADTALATIRPEVLPAEPEPSRGTATPPDAATPAAAPEAAPPEAQATADPSAAAQAERPAAVDPRVALKARYAARAKVPVTLYTADWCFVCDQARDYLIERGVAVQSLDIEADATAEQRLLKFNRARSLPSFEVAGKPIIGFNPSELESTIDAAASAAR